MTTTKVPYGATWAYFASPESIAYADGLNVPKYWFDEHHGGPRQRFTHGIKLLSDPDKQVADELKKLTWKETLIGYSFEKRPRTYLCDLPPAPNPPIELEQSKRGFGERDNSVQTSEKPARRDGIFVTNKDFSAGNGLG